MKWIVSCLISVSENVSAAGPTHYIGGPRFRRLLGPVVESCHWSWTGPRNNWPNIMSLLLSTFGWGSKPGSNRRFGWHLTSWGMEKFILNFTDTLEVLDASPCEYVLCPLPKSLLLARANTWPFLTQVLLAAVLKLAKQFFSNGILCLYTTSIYIYIIYIYI